MFFILLLILPGIVKSTPVVGGKDAGKIALIGKNKMHAFNPGKYPFLALLEITEIVSQDEMMEDRDYSMCGGTLITPGIVLTAAHCLDQTINEPEIQVTVGTVHKKLRLSFQIAKVIDYVIHQYYEDTTSTGHGNGDAYNQNDISILWLDKEFILTDKVQIAFLAERDFPVENQIGRIAGWGLTDTGVLPNLLQEGKLRIISNTDCRIAHHPVQVISSMMCAISDDGKTIHGIGDSGGPLIVHGVVVGIISWAEGKYMKCKDGRIRNNCDPSFPGVFTRVSEFLNWIRHNVKLGPPESRISGLDHELKRRLSKKFPKSSCSKLENLTTDEKSLTSTYCKSSKSQKPSKSCTII